MLPITPKTKKDAPVWRLTATEVKKLLRGEIVYRASWPIRLQIKRDVLERELDSILEKV